MNMVDNVRRVQKIGFGRVWKSDVVGNKRNGERGEGGDIIQAAPGGSGVAEAHVAVGYSDERPPTRGVIVSDAAANASTCLTQDKNYTYSTNRRREILNKCDESCNLGYDSDGNIGPFYDAVEE